jgi:hypothetical protein
MEPSLKFVTGKEHCRKINDPQSDFLTSKNRGRNSMKIEHLAALICALSAVSVGQTSPPTATHKPRRMNPFRLKEHET